MYQVYATMIQEWEQAGGGLLNIYVLAGYPGGFGFFGMLPTVDSPGSQKFDAVLSTLLPTADANGDGIVDDADFQAVQANYEQGQGPTYWRQGDFNDDGTTNAADLNILRQQLNPAGFTLAQFAAAGRLRRALHRRFPDRARVRRLRGDLCEQPPALLDDGDRTARPG